MGRAVRPEGSEAVISLQDKEDSGIGVLLREGQALGIAGAVSVLMVLQN